MKVVLLSVLMMVSMAAEAEWTYVATSDSGEVFFIDFSTFKRTKEGYRRVWELLDASNAALHQLCRFGGSNPIDVLKLIQHVDVIELLCFFR